MQRTRLEGRWEEGKRQSKQAQYDDDNVASASYDQEIQNCVMDLQGLKKKGKVGKEVNLELGISANSEEENGKEDEVLD